MELDSALLKPAAGEAAPRRAPVAAVRPLLKPALSLLLHAAALLLAAAVLAVMANIPDEVMAPGSALGSATVWTFRGVAGVDAVVALAALAAASGALGLAVYAATPENAKWLGRHVSVVAFSFTGFATLVARWPLDLDLLHAARAPSPSIPVRSSYIKTNTKRAVAAAMLSLLLLACFANQAQCRVIDDLLGDERKWGSSANPHCWHNKGACNPIFKYQCWCCALDENCARTEAECKQNTICKA